tara:strand:+ start:814 stop:1110 length:297 start_codon:yes stop_codon:yes gene_type:complete
MNIYKLQYDTKAQADADFLDKGVTQVVEEEGQQQTVYANGTQAIVDIGIIENETGVFYDIMTTEHIDFGSHALTPTKCLHGFAGYSIDANGDNVEPQQ